MQTPSPALKMIITLILSIIQVILCMALAHAIYGGKFENYLHLGTILSLAGSGILIIVLALFTEIPLAVGRPQGEPLPFFILMSQFIGHSEPTSILTLLTAIVLTSLLTGILLFLCGLLKLGNLIRFIPFSITAGFLASTGLLLILSGTNQVFIWSGTFMQTITHWAEKEQLLLWVPTVLFGLVAFLLGRLFKGSLVFIGLLVASVVCFYLVVLFSGASFAQLKSAGLLLNIEPLSIKELLGTINFDEPIRWLLILQTTKTMVLISIISAISLLFITMSVELMIKKDVNFNKELKVAGIGNILGGSVGGLVGYQGLVNASFLHKFNINSRVVGVFCGFCCLFMIFFADKALNYIPKFIFIGLIIFLGINLFYEWTFEIRKKLAISDKIILLAVILVTMIFGLLEGMAAGLLIATSFFIVTYSKTQIIRYKMNGSELASLTKREPMAYQLIKNNGKKIIYLRLQEYLFFGSANVLIKKIKAIIDEKEVKYIILDLERVSGIDSSVENSFEKIENVTRQNGVTLILTGVLENKNVRLRKKITKIASTYHFLLIPLAEDAIDHCESLLLKDLHYEPTEKEDFKIAMEDYLGRKELAAGIAQFFETMTINKDEYLVRQNDASHELFYLESGYLNILIETGPNHKRLISKIGPGNFVGEVAFYLHSPRSASIIAGSRCVLKKLNHKHLMKMKLEYPALAEAFSEALICSLATRLVDTNKKVKLLSK